MSKKYKVIHKARLAQSILSSTDKKEWQMKNSISNEIWTFWVHCYVIWIKKYISHLSTTDQQHDTKISEYLCDHISEWYSNIFQHTQETSQTCMKDVEETW